MGSEKYTFTVDVETLNAIKKLKEVGEEARNTADQNTKGAKNASAAWATFGGVVGGSAVIGAFKSIAGAASSAFSTILESTKTTERIKTELAVMTGSVEGAEAAYAKLQVFAAKTPFAIEGIADSARSLIAFGFDAATVTDKLQIIGDVSSGSGNDLKDLTQIFGQVAAAGKLTGERFNQLAERAIPIGSAIAKTMGVTESAVKDLVSNGKVSFKDFEKAFASLSAEGGLFFDGMNKKSQTLDGILSTLSDTFDQSASDIGGAFLPAIKEAVTALSSFIEANRAVIKAFAQKFGESFIAFFKESVELGKSFATFVSNNSEALKFLGTALVVGGAGWAAYALAVTGAAAAQAAFAAVNPVVLALGAVVIAVTAAIRYWDELKIAFYSTVGSIAELASSIPGLGDKMQKLAQQANAEAAAIQAAKDQKEADALATEELANKKSDAADISIAARKKDVDAGINLNKDELKAAADHQKALAELKLEQRVAEEQLRIVDNEASLLESDARFQGLVAQLGREEAIKAEARLRTLAAEKQTTENVRAQELLRETIKKQALDRQSEYEFKGREKELKDQQEHNKKLAEEAKKAADEAKTKRDGDLLYFMNQKDREADWTKQTERQKLDTVRSSFSTLAGLSRDGNKQLGEIGKASAIAGATIDTYKAATGAYASLAGIPLVGPALGAAAAAAAVVAGMANVRQINSQRYERGGIVSGSSYTGDNITARVNSGELILNRAQQKNLAPQLSGNDNSDLVQVMNGLRADVQNLKLIVGDEDVMNAVIRQKDAGRII